MYTRKKNIIKGPEGTKTFQFINEAKRESRRLQMESDRALGRGTVKVDKS